MATTFGIFFGNTSCCIAVCKDGKVDVVANAVGDRVTPFVVAFHESEVVTGLAAKQGIVRNEPSTVLNALRTVVSREEGGDDNPTPAGTDAYFSVQRGERTGVRVKAGEVFAQMFKLLRDIAVSHTTDTELPVVIALPAWMTPRAASIVRESAGCAGFTVLRNIAQPAAAVLAYNLLEDNQISSTVLVLHIGGTSVVGCVVEISGGLASVKETVTLSSTPSGNILTELLVQHLAREFYQKYKCDALESRRSKRKLYIAAENCKHVLSTMNTAQVHVESLAEGIDFSTVLSRARFEGIVSSSLVEAVGVGREAVERSGLCVGQVGKVLLTGGSSKIPRLQQLVADEFPQAEVLFRLPPDEVSAVGAGVESGIVNGRILNGDGTRSAMVSALARDVYCGCVENNTNQLVFGRGAPTHSRQQLTIPIPPLACSVVIYEAENAVERPKEPQILAEVMVNNLTQLKMNFHLRSDGSLHATLTESESKTDFSFDIEAGMRSDQL